MYKIISINNPNLFDVVIERAENAISTELDNETMILDIASGVYSGLDLVGTTVWDLIEKPVSFSAIVEGVRANYEVSEKECVSDLVKFLEKMLETRLIAIANQC